MPHQRPIEPLARVPAVGANGAQWSVHGRSIASDRMYAASVGERHAEFRWRPRPPKGTECAPTKRTPTRFVALFAAAQLPPRAIAQSSGDLRVVGTSSNSPVTRHSLSRDTRPKCWRRIL